MFSGTEINGWAVLAAALAAMGVGMVWYSPFLFAKPWMRLSGMGESQNREAKSGGMAKTYLMAFAGNLAQAMVLAYFIYWTAVTTLPTGLLTGFLVWLGFIATVMLGSVLWEHKPWRLYFINAGYYLTALLVMSAILVLFP